MSRLAWARWTQSRQDALAGYGLVIPALALLGLFVLFPLGYTIYLSLTSWNMISPTKSFVGLDNYQRLFSSADFTLVLRNTLVYSVGSVGLTMLLGLGLAVLLDWRMQSARWVRAFLFSPYVTPMVAVSILWVWLYDVRFGLINWFLSLFGLPAVPWLSSPDWALSSLIVMKVWKVLGYYTYMFLAGLQNIPGALYEAAQIDGAGPWQRFRQITLPMLSPVTLFVLIVAIIASFQDFDQIYTMTRGGPANSTATLVFYLYQNGFQFFKVGYASAVAVVIFAMLLTLTGLQFYLSKKWVHYD